MSGALGMVYLHLMAPASAEYVRRTGLALSIAPVTETDVGPALREAAPGHWKACIRDDLALRAPQ